MRNHFNNGFVVTYDKAVELPLVSQHLSQGERASRGRHAIQIVKGRHIRRDPRMPHSLERFQVDIPEQDLGDPGGVVVPPGFSATVESRPWPPLAGRAERLSATSVRASLLASCEPRVRRFSARCPLGALRHRMRRARVRTPQKPCPRRARPTSLAYFSSLARYSDTVQSLRQ